MWHTGLTVGTIAWSALAIRASLPTEGGKLAGDPEEEDGPDDATVRRARPGNDVVKPRMMSAGFERSAQGGGHDGVHGDQAHSKGRQPQEPLRSAAKAGGKKEQGKLARGLGADPVQHADQEDRFAVVHPLKSLRFWGLRVP